ncbi:hypothetical protein V8F33_010696 [Rhypophila sp. PSN 637]
MSFGHGHLGFHTNSWAGKPEGFPTQYESSTRDMDRFTWDHKSMNILYSTGNSGYNGEPTPRRNKYLQQPRKTRLLQQPRPSQQKRQLEAHQARYRRPGHGNLISPFFQDRPASALHARLGHQRRRNLAIGTSMACSLVASCVAVLLGALVDNGVTEPSSPLIKTLLVNGVVPLQGTRHNDTNFDSGFARVNLENSLANAVSTGSLAGFGDIKHVETDVLAKNGKNPESFSFEIPVPADESNGKTTLKITMAYTDRPGQQLQSDLNLIVAMLVILVRTGRGESVISVRTSLDETMSGLG